MLVSKDPTGFGLLYPMENLISFEHMSMVLFCARTFPSTISKRARIREIKSSGKRIRHISSQIVDTVLPFAMLTPMSL